MCRSRLWQIEDGVVQRRSMVKSGFHEKEFDDATLVKLRIFRQYAREWISVLLTRSSRQFGRLNIYDFFAGREEMPQAIPDRL